MTKQLDLYGNCAHLHTKPSNFMTGSARTCLDCGDNYVYTVCKNNIHNYSMYINQYN